MAFIKVKDVIINTSYIAAIRLERQACAEDLGVALLIAVPTAALSPQESPNQSLYHYEWLEFTGDAARALQDYFSSFNNVIDLLPQYDSPTYCGTQRSRRDLPD
jgi:hypothetical protein